VIAVEGYVDVIAMVTAGFEATVAPLGTALTEDQLASLWRMSDEPILCFDGDAAGHRAAYRAIDLALPRIEPGKSLRFASLPQGHDPDDLIRSGGPAAMTDVLAMARPLADVLWTRETESGRFDTPERRAGLEARINELTNAISHEAVRRHYRQEFWHRLRSLTAVGDGGRSLRGTAQGGFGRGIADRWGHRHQGRRESLKEAPLAPLSAKLQESSIVRGSRSALQPREALILLVALNHPWLLETQAEQLAELELNGDADMLRRLLLDITASRQPDRAALREAVVARGCQALLQRIEAAVTHLADWPARAEAAPEDVRQLWAHVLTLHRRNRTLNKELKEAERALGEEPSEENFAWLQDVRAQLSSPEGTEASIEGFGALSGRPAGGP
jgi:DNA primase